MSDRPRNVASHARGVESGWETNRADSMSDAAESALSRQASTDRANAPEPERTPDILWTLWFEQFKQVSWLGVAAAGGALLIPQVTTIELTLMYGAAVVLCALSAAVAVVGQSRLIDHLSKGRAIDQNIRAYLYTAFALLGAGAGALIGVMT